MTSIRHKENLEPNANIWESIKLNEPKTKLQLTMRVDRDIIKYFKGAGSGYQTRINAVLRSYVDSMLRKK